MTDHSQMKLGRKAVKKDPRTLKLAHYLAQTVLPQAPAAIDWGASISDWGMMANDRYGDCTCAGVGHMVRLWNEKNGNSVTIPDSTILELYSLVTGEEGAAFDVNTGANDNGCAEIDVLNAFRNAGLAAAPEGVHKINAYASVDPSKVDLLRAAIWLFGGTYIGIALPLSAQSQDVWDVASPADLSGNNEPGSWGGHCVILTGYDADGLTCITWGAPKRLTWRWLAAYCDEAYALLSGEWLAKSGLAPSDFNTEQLQADLSEV